MRAPTILGLARLVVGLALLIAAVTACTAIGRVGQGWWELRRDASGQAPDPSETPEPVLQVYAARTVGWRGLLAVHTWVAWKRGGATAYTRYEVMGWGVDRGNPALRVDRAGPDDHWFGARPDLLVDRRGPEVDALITRVEDAIRTYPYPAAYRSWPGPNSNTFTAHIGRSVPELRLDLPPTAIGKDFLPGGAVAAFAPSGTGLQVSALGLLGLLAGWEEGLEINVLGLTFGVDLNRPALKLPAVGRVGFP